MVLGGVAMGVRKHAEAEMAIPMTMGSGEIPVAMAMGMARGAIRAAVAVFDMKFVTTAVRAQHTSMSIQGSETWLTTAWATMAAAPDEDMAADMESMPANRKIVVQSTLRKASRMVIQRVITIRQAPSMAAGVSGISLVTIMTTTKAKIRIDSHILLVRRASLGWERNSAPGLALGRSL